VIQAGTRAFVTLIFLPITVAVRDSQDPPGPANVSGR
jgi:hypothetical protein